MRTTAKIEKLLQTTPESYYWAGMIAADGCILERKRLKLALKDKDHLNKFAEFLEIDYDGRDCVSVQNIEVISKFCQRFDLRPQKTYNPPKRFKLKGDEFISFLIGFIDGDGSIQYQSGRKDCLMSIKCHKSWVSMLEIFSKSLYSLAGSTSGPVRINSCGYAVWIVSNSIVLKFLKRMAVRLELPILKRKWDRIDLDYVSRQETGEHRKKEVLQLKKAGHRQKDICELLGMKAPAVCMILKRANHEQ